MAWKGVCARFLRKPLAATRTRRLEAIITSDEPMYRQIPTQPPRTPRNDFVAAPFLMAPTATIVTIVCSEGVAAGCKVATDT
jgi:hypothetical protein